MKKRSWMIVAMVLTLTMLAAGSAMARWDGAQEGRGQRGYYCWGADGDSDVDLENMVKFRKETLPLRDQLWEKKLELSREYANEKPDADKIAKLRKEMVDIRMSIEKAAGDNGLDDWGPRRGARMGSDFRYGGGCPGGRF